MRRTILCGLLVLMGCIHAQRLIVAGGDSESLQTRTEQLIKRHIQQPFDKEAFRKRAIEAGFSVVGDDQVAYLIPLHLTPEYVDTVFLPLYDYLKNRDDLVKVTELPEMFREEIFRIYQEDAMQYHLQNISLAQFQERLRAGEVWIRAGDWWRFATNEGEAEPNLYLAEHPRFIKKLPHSELPQPTPSASPNRRDAPATPAKNQWWFLFSAPLRLTEQTEHMQAYLEWLKVLHVQRRERMIQAMNSIYSQLYKSPHLLPETVYRWDDLPEEIRALRWYSRQPPTSDTVLTFKRWEPRLWLVYQDPLSTTGTIEVYLPLDTFYGND
ncbi:MAG: hypothetical protein KatS3mg016_1895 [Fimbriimonadales bacterium]|nr:MAG: hypothetical protein KatS3mg016_1895 [Fimbriimonadales bacterium]